jgi:hypothetical protein
LAWSESALERSVAVQFPWDNVKLDEERLSQKQKLAQIVAEPQISSSDSLVAASTIGEFDTCSSNFEIEQFQDGWTNQRRLPNITEKEVIDYGWEDLPAEHLLSWQSTHTSFPTFFPH